jgi:transposase
MPSKELTRLLDLGEYRVVNIDEETDEAVTLFIESVHPHPVCPGCGQACLFVHSTEDRTVRHLDAFHRRCYLRFDVRFIRCPNCGLKAEANDLVASRKRSTKAFRRYVGSLCRLLPNSQVADHVGLSEDTIRTIDKEYLAETYPPPDFGRLRRLAIDEIAYRKGHNYLTVVLDYDSGEVVWTGEGRSEATLSTFFELIGLKVCRQIVAVSMDMAAGYIKAVQLHCPNARVVFDRFHVAKHLNEAVNDTRKQTMARASEEQRRVVKGKRFILLRRFGNLEDHQVNELDELLELNTDLTAAYLLKEQFEEFWTRGNAGAAAKFLDSWIREAIETEIPPLVRVAKTLEKHRSGLLAYHTHRMTNGPLEGLNTKVNVLRRSRYGFRDLEYFGMKIRQQSIERSPRQDRRVRKVVT